MYQVILMWNLSNPHQEMQDNVKEIKFRGYKPESYLTGEFAVKVNNKIIKPLSVSNISDRYCSVQRDLYFRKGLNPPAKVKDKETWGRVVGNLAEKNIEELFSYKEKIGSSYSAIIKEGGRFNSGFIKTNSRKIDQLNQIEKEEKDVAVGDTEWLLKLLTNNGRAEFALKLLHSHIENTNSLVPEQISMKTEIKPIPERIGLNSPAVPDFIIPDFGIVGDIKTGIEFKPFHQLTCAGYALAYENEKGKKHDINWGIIYFFPTRNPSAYVRPISFAQIYIFPIDDHLRQWFLNVRNESYDIISKKSPPKLPSEENRTHCSYCKYKEYCITEK